ncbi:taste receptor type 2 member 1-like [Rhinoderma darwinii]|uniref:taste receptor type 2 member 1-like n=1 Tax=Rhinoderma darwinii TaxID=43563 RepID=UPI003F66EB16
MNFLAILFLLTVNWFIILIGLLLNLFIVVMNFTWWLKGQALQSIDIIITSLGSVRIILLIIYIFVVLMSDDLIVPVDDSDGTSYRITAILFVIFCSLWWGTVLGTFYCVKITIYRNKLFLRLKMNISSMVPWILVGSMVISFISSLPGLWDVISVDYRNFTSFDSGNISINEGIPYLKTKFLNLIIINFAGTIIPLLIFCVSIYLLIVSVLKHTKNLNSNHSGFTKAQLEAHKNVIINLVSFLFFYLLFFINSNLLVFTLYTKDSIFIYLCCICVSSYPSLHSILLIVGNAKLKKSILSAFQAVLSKKNSNSIT